jgi:excisionase family DNA binding protein
MKSTGELWVGSPEAAGRLGVTLRTLYGFIDAGDIPAYKMGRVIRLKAADIDAYVEKVRLKPGDLKHLFPPDSEPPEGGR